MLGSCRDLVPTLNWRLFDADGTDDASVDIVRLPVVGHHDIDHFRQTLDPLAQICSVHPQLTRSTLLGRTQWRTGAPEAFQDWYGENHPISRPDDGGTEGHDSRARRGRREAPERRGGRVWGGAP